MKITEMWQNQLEAVDFAKDKPAVMIEFDMGTGKTLTTIHMIMRDDKINKVLVVCPSKVIDVWRGQFERHVENYENYLEIYDPTSKSITGLKKAIYLNERLNKEFDKKFVFVVSYESVWRKPLADVIRGFNFDMVVLDESHRAKAAGSKVSKYLALLGKNVKKRICLSGTPMTNSTLDVYGQYRFLDPTIFGTRYDKFLDEYAIMGGADRRFPVGVKNQDKLMRKYKSIACICKMDDIKDRLKLPDKLPPVIKYTELSSKDQKIMKEFSKEFVSEIGNKTLSAKNILEKILRLQQITSGFCTVTDEFGINKEIKTLNTQKIDLLADTLEDLQKDASLVIFCVFRYDIDACVQLCKKMQRKVFEMSGKVNELEEWKKQGGVLIVQVQSGAEGVDMTMAYTAIYYSLPSLPLYNQSKARLYRPGQKNPVTFIHLIVKNSIDEDMYEALINKKNLIEGIQKGEIEFGYLKR